MSILLIIAVLAFLVSMIVVMGIWVSVNKSLRGIHAELVCKAQDEVWPPVEDLYPEVPNKEH